MQKRGLFQTIFGNKQQEGKNYTQFKLLNSYQTQFIPFTGNAWDVNTVRAAVHSFCRRAATIQPRHIRRGEGKFIEVNSPYNQLLRNAPNPYTTAYKFYYRMAAQYKLYNNAFAYPVWDETGLKAIYNVNPSSVELLEYQGEMFVRFGFIGGNKYTIPYSEIIHVGSMFENNDVFGSSNYALNTVLDTANTFNQAMSKQAELVTVLRGILEVQANVKSEDLNRRREEFIKDNLSLDSDGAGIVVTDNKYKYTPISDKQSPLPAEQLHFVKTEIYDYFGVNEDIVQNKETPEQADAFYDGELKPFFLQLSQAYTKCLFSKKELGFGNEIIAEGNKLQYAKLSDKLNAVRYLSDIGGLQLDQALVTLGFPPIGGEEGKRRVQTLNMVNADKVDDYQGVGEEEKNAD